MSCLEVTVFLSLIMTLSLLCASLAAVPTGVHASVSRASIDAPVSSPDVDHGVHALAMAESEGPDVDDGDDAITTRDGQRRPRVMESGTAVVSRLGRGWTCSITALACAPRAPPRS